MERLPLNMRETTIIRATHITKDIYEAIEQYLPETIRVRWNAARTAEEREEILWETAFDYMNKIAPEGSYFGAHPGDGSDYGFWDFDPDSREEGCLKDDISVLISGMNTYDRTFQSSEYNRFRTTHELWELEKAVVATIQLHDLTDGRYDLVNKAYVTYLHAKWGRVPNTWAFQPKHPYLQNTLLNYMRGDADSVQQ